MPVDVKEIESLVCRSGGWPIILDVKDDGDEPPTLITQCRLCLLYVAGNADSVASAWKTLVNMCLHCDRKPGSPSAHTAYEISPDNNAD